MKRSYCVTVVTEIDFVGGVNEDIMNRHLDDIVEAVRAGAESVSTRVTAAVNVTYCGGGVIAAHASSGTAGDDAASAGGDAASPDDGAAISENPAART